jgi:hypothetical protein
VAYLRSLPALCADSGPDGPQALALALFARTEVTGFEQMSYQLTPEAIELGLNAALPPVYELKASIAEFGRGERIRADTPSSSLLIPVANIPSYVGRVWKTA